MKQHNYVIRRGLLLSIVFSSVVLGIPAVQGKEFLPIRIAATADAVSIPQWIAMKHGIFQKHGLYPQETLFNVNYQGLLALGAGQEDASIQSDPPTVTNLAKGIDAVVVGVVARFPEGYHMVADKSVQSMEDLAGKKVAWPKGTGAEYALIQIAKQKHFDLSRFEHVDLPPAEAVPLLIKGDVDAIFYWEPWPRITVRKGDGRFHSVISSKGAYESNMFLTVRGAFAKEHPDAVKSLLRVFEEAQEMLRNNPEEGVAIFQQRMRVDEQTARDSVSDYEFMVRLDKQTAKTVEEISGWLVTNGRISKAPQWSALFDASYLKSVNANAVKGFPW